IGRCDACTLTIDDPVPGDGSGPIVFGAERTYDATKTKTVWQGTDMRFRLIGGFYRLRIRGLGLNVSAVGNGQGWISGTGEVPDGVWSLNGSDYRSLPDVPTPFILGTGVGG